MRQRSLEASPDIHRKILTYLSGAEVALTLRVSRYWRATAARYWKLWYQLRRQDSTNRINLDEFRRMAETPVEAYQLSDPVRLYVDALKCASNLSNRFYQAFDDSVKGNDGTPLLSEEKKIETLLLGELTEEEDTKEAKHPTPEFNSEQDFDFEVTLPIFDRIYSVIRDNLPRRGLLSYYILRNLLRNLGRTGSIATISEFYTSVRLFNDRLHGLLGDAYITDWLSTSPGRKYLLPFILDRNDRDVRKNIWHHLWLGARDRGEVADALAALL